MLILEKDRTRIVTDERGETVMRLINVGGHCVAVSFEKTVMVLLNGSLSSSRPPVVRVNRVSLRYEAEVKYLGITTNDGGKFIQNLDKVTDKLMNVVRHIHRILQCKLGPTRRALQIHDVLFVACATYGVLV